MKLLLTSDGLRNDTLIQALVDLAGTPVYDLKLAFIPTGMHPVDGDKSWFVDDLNRVYEMGFNQFDIVDVAVLSKEVWLPRLQQADVIYVNGGHTTYLMTCFRDSGLTDLLPKLLKSRVFVGASAGSYIATPDTRFNSDNVDEVLDGLGLVSFGLQAHLNNPKFAFTKNVESVTDRVKALNSPYVVYALDDNMAIKVDGDRHEVVGEGEFVTFKP